MDRFVHERLVRWLCRRSVQRKTRRVRWTAEQFWAMGLYILRGTVRYAHPVTRKGTRRKPHDASTASKSTYGKERSQAFSFSFRPP